MLLVEKDDIYMTESYDYGGGHDAYFTFRCPVCSAQTDIAEGAISSSIRDLARVKKMRSASSSGWSD